MDIVGLGTRVQIFVDEGDSVEGNSLYLAILEKLRAEGAAGATVTRGIAGFGAHSRIRTARLADLASPLPLVITWVDAPDRVERLLPSISAMVREGLITVEDVRIAKYTHRDLPALRPSLNVGDLMTGAVTAVQRRTPLAEVVGLLLDRDFRAVPVVEESGRLVGIITNGDLVERGGLPARLELLAVLEPDARQELLAAAEARTAEQVMTHPPIVAGPDVPLEAAVRLMLNEGLKRLPVIDADGRLVGMISRADILRALGEGYPVPEWTHPVAKAEARTLGDIMNSNVPAVREDARLAEVLDAVVSTRLNRAVVINGEGRVVGVISDADVLRRLDPRVRSGILGALMRRGRIVPEEASRVIAAEMMRTPPFTMTPETPVDVAARRMVQARRKVLPVVDEQGRLLGIVDRADLLAAARRTDTAP